MYEENTTENIISEIWLNYEGVKEDIAFEWDIAILLRTGKLIVLDCKTFVKDKKESRAQRFNVHAVGGSFAERYEVFPAFQEDEQAPWLITKIKDLRADTPKDAILLDNQGTFEHFLNNIVHRTKK